MEKINNKWQFVVYQHINPTNNNVFYIGSGTVGREYQLGKYHRGGLYHLYCKNNNLIVIHGLNTSYNVKIEIIAVFFNRQDAYALEGKLIKELYGRDGYQLVNSQVGFNNYSSNLNNIIHRSIKVSEARRRAVINKTDGQTFNSITAMALHYNIQRATLQKRLAKCVTGYSFGDGINPHYLL